MISPVFASATHKDTDACVNEESARNVSADFSCEYEQTVRQVIEKKKNIILISELIYLIGELTIARMQPECLRHDLPLWL